MAIVFLDTGILGLVTSPRKQGQALACEQWMLSLLARGVNIISSEICDYEVRRNLILETNFSSNFSSLSSLDELLPSRRKIIENAWILLLSTDCFLTAEAQRSQRA
jgi:hypothetical protein